MSRLVGLLFLAIVVWVFLEVGWAKLQKRVGAGRPGPRTTTELVQCARCGDYVPRGRLVGVGGKLLCERCRA